MPVITPSALITEIKGKWHGSVFQMWKGAITVRRTTRPRHTAKVARARYKGFVSTIAGCYDSLTSDQKTGWACYADLLPTEMSGFNAFLARNTTVLCPDVDALTYFADAPVAFAIPESPAPIAAAYLPVPDQFCLTWSSPSCAALYVQGFIAPQAGFSNLKSPSWRHSVTVLSDTLHLTFDGSVFPSGTVIRFRARTINTQGEPSPWSGLESATKS